MFQFWCCCIDPSRLQEAQCEDGDIRLVNGSTPLEGRLEICFNRAWGTVCNNMFSVEDANVSCNQLGFPFNGANVLPIADFSQGSGPIFLDEVACHGEERTLAECGTLSPHGLHACTHNQDTAIRCIGEFSSEMFSSVLKSTLCLQITMSVLSIMETVIITAQISYLVISVAVAISTLWTAITSLVFAMLFVLMEFAVVCMALLMKRPLHREVESMEPSTALVPFIFVETETKCIFFPFVSDINECLSNNHSCNNNNYCVNQLGSYQCVCNAGYSGDGNNCSKIPHVLSQILNFWLCSLRGWRHSPCEWVI